MSNFDTEFITELFLDDSISTINKLIVATANVVNENLENISLINNVHFVEQNQVEQFIPNRSSGILLDSHDRKHFYENIVQNYTDEEYVEKFKMKRRTVQTLISFLKEHIRHGNSVVPLEKKVHVFLWLLGTEASFKVVGEIFGLHKSSVSYIFHEIAALLSEQRYQFINWPSPEEQHITRVKVNNWYGFPNCVGFIDACRFRVGSKRKKKDKPETVLLQAVCDETLMFFDIHIGEIRNTKKSKVYRESQLGQELKKFIDFDNHILGDSEYKLKKNLITPFTSEEVLTPEEMKFNEIHWKAHTYIRHAFETLRERFRKLNHIDISKPDAVNTMICAACVLHNFILFHEGSPVKDEKIIHDEGIHIDNDLVKTAAEKRQFLCNYINYIHNS